MKATGRCPKCGSRNIIADAKVIDRGDAHIQFEFTLSTFRNPEALIFKKTQTTTVSAWVCGECGLVEFYADNPKAIEVPKAG